MPNKPVQFLSLDEALTIHERLITVFGGPVGMRALGLLEQREANFVELEKWIAGHVR